MSRLSRRFRAVEHLLKAVDQLHLVQKDVELLGIVDLSAHIFAQRLAVQQIFVLLVIQRDAEDTLRGDALREKILVEEMEQQIRLAAAPDPGDDLDGAVFPALDQLVQIKVSFDFLHRARLLRKSLYMKNIS